MNEDTIWINLKVLARLPPYHRINTHNELFQVEKNTLWHPAALWRFLRGDNRELAIKRIDDLIEKAMVLSDKIANGPMAPRLLLHLRDAKQGLLNLKKTYLGDLTAQASLDRLLDKIESLLPPVEEEEEVLCTQ